MATPAVNETSLTVQDSDNTETKAPISMDTADGISKVDEPINEPITPKNGGAMEEKK